MSLLILAILAASAGVESDHESRLWLIVKVNRTGSVIAWHARSGCTVGNEKFASQNAPPVGSIHSQFSFGYNPSKSSRVPHAIKLTLDAEDVGLLHMSTDLIAPHGRVPAVPYGVMLNELIFEPCGVPPFGPSDWTRVLDRRRIDRRATLAVLREWIAWTEPVVDMYYDPFYLAVRKCGRRRACQPVIDVLSAWSQASYEMHHGSDVERTGEDHGS